MTGEILKFVDFLVVVQLIHRPARKMVKLEDFVSPCSCNSSAEHTFFYEEPNDMVVSIFMLYLYLDLRRTRRRTLPPPRPQRRRPRPRLPWQETATFFLHMHCTALVSLVVFVDDEGCPF